MAYKIKTGDTHPPLTVKVEASVAPEDADWPKRYHPTDPETGVIDTTKWVKRVDFFTIATRPDSFRIILKLATPATTVVMLNANIENAEVVDGSSATLGTSEVEPGLNVPANRGILRGIWQAGQTDQESGTTAADAYRGETEVTWDSGSTPPKIETFPNDDANNFVVIMRPDLD